MTNNAPCAYELVVDKGGPKIGPPKSGAPAASNGGFPFHGGMRQLADLIALQLTISAPADPARPGFAGGPPPVVLDKTGLEGVYDFAVDIRPEPGGDMVTLWQRYAQERLGLNSRAPEAWLQSWSSIALSGLRKRIDLRLKTQAFRD
jgi:uncharacterized protein (TIGR03435 family)